MSENGTRDFATLAAEPRAERRWTFDGDGADLRLLSEALRLRRAHLFDPYLAVHISDVAPLPHQIAAVYGQMLPRQPLRFLLADDPGAGKTVMTGLYIKELIARGDLDRCLIVCPGSLVEQWRDELARKFRLEFEILDSARIADPAFAGDGLFVARLDKLARDDAARARAAAIDWDLVVCDEAHKMSASVVGGEVKSTKRRELGRALSRAARNFLLLTATPHNGKEEEFRVFLSLLDEDRFARAEGNIDASDLLRRTIKEEMVNFDGSPLFPRRESVSLQYDLSPGETELYERVSAYAREQFNLAERLKNGNRRTTVGFALTVLQRRLASSPEAIYQSLRRRRERLERRLAEARSDLVRWDEERETEGFDEEELTAGEMEALEDRVADGASAAATSDELRAEIVVLADLEKLADRVRRSGVDRKWSELSNLLQSEEIARDERGRREKLIIFTEHKDTLNYLADRIRCLLGDPDAVATIDGSLSREERLRAENAFREKEEVSVLAATDAAGEGINLQRARMVVNYDLPWNPNRIEQRFGRAHRVGQTRPCYLWNLVARNTREGAVFQRLFEKLENEKAALGGKVYDILGQISFANRPLRDLLLEAARGEISAGRAAATVDAALNRDALLALLRERSALETPLNPDVVAALREDMARADAGRLQPGFVGPFFKEIFARLGGKLYPREPGRYEITYVPSALRRSKAVRRRYRRVCFDRDKLGGDAELICPGHPLLEAAIDAFNESRGDSLRRGAVLIDDNDPGVRPRLLFYSESTILRGKRILSSRVRFLELKDDGSVADAGPAPYLDCRAPDDAERERALELIKTIACPDNRPEETALRWAAERQVPEHLREVRERLLPLIAKSEKAAANNLTWGIRALIGRAYDLAALEKAEGRDAGSAGIREKASEMEIRLKQRRVSASAAREIVAAPPRLLGAALILPAGLLAGSPDDAADPEARARVERAAMAEVMAIERELGFEPRDVSAEKRGYDIESASPANGESPRFIEVKGRAAGADSVSVTRNEILTALNIPGRFILALVEVSENGAKTVYLKRPFRNPPDFSLLNGSFNIAKLIAGAETVFTKDSREQS